VRKLCHSLVVLRFDPKLLAIDFQRFLFGGHKTKFGAYISVLVFALRDHWRGVAGDAKG